MEHSRCRRTHCVHRTEDGRPGNGEKVADLSAEPEYRVSFQNQLLGCLRWAISASPLRNVPGSPWLPSSVSESRPVGGHGVSAVEPAGPS